MIFSIKAFSKHNRIDFYFSVRERWVDFSNLSKFGLKRGEPNRAKSSLSSSESASAGATTAACGSFAASVAAAAAAAGASAASDAAPPTTPTPTSSAVCWCTKKAVKI